MEFTNQLADLFSRGIWILAICGLLLYLPLKSHWNRIFSFWDALIFYCSLGVPALLIVSYIQNTEDRGAGSLIFTIAVSAIAILIGFVVLCCSHSWPAPASSVAMSTVPAGTTTTDPCAQNRPAPCAAARRGAFLATETTGYVGGFRSQ